MWTHLFHGRVVDDPDRRVVPQFCAKRGKTRNGPSIFNLSGGDGFLAERFNFLSKIDRRCLEKVHLEVRAEGLGFHLGVFCDQVLDCRCQGRGAQSMRTEGFLRVASLRFSSDVFQARVFLEVRQAEANV